MSPMRRSAELALFGIRAAIATSGIAPPLRPTAEIYLLVTGCDLTGARAAEAYGCTKQNVSKALKVVETRREDAAFDAALTAIEFQLFGGP